MLMIEVIANTMLMMVFLGVGLAGGMRLVHWLNDAANRSVVRIESRNLDHSLRRMLDD